MDGSPSSSVSLPSTRSLLIVGTFVLLVCLTVGAAVSTSAALTAHMEAEASVDADVVGVEPADADSIDVELSVTNPTHADMEFFSAYMPVSQDGEVVASNAGLGFDAAVVPAGETVTFTITAVAASGVDGDALHEAAEAGELRPEGRVEGRIVDRTFHVSIEGAVEQEGSADE